MRLLANTMAHQWWGSEVSPKTLDDAWITNGMSRYGELMYLEDDSGASAMRAALKTWPPVLWPMTPLRSPASAGSTPSRHSSSR